MIFYYKVYGLIIKSEIKLPEAYEVEVQAADVFLHYGIMRSHFCERKAAGYDMEVLNRKYKWFYVQGEGHFLIENGIDITVEVEDTAREINIRALILGTCLAAILYQRDIISIHGSAIVWKDKAIIISGVSGAGKSTITTELRKRGCLFMADDTVAITSNNGTLYANPGYPQQKLCADTALEYGYSIRELTRVEDGREKYAVSLQEEFCATNKEPAGLIILNVDEVEQLIAEEITGSSKLEYILQNLYAYHSFHSVGMNTNAFKNCLDIARKLPIIKVTRPSNVKSIGQIAELILDFISNTVAFCNKEDI